MCNVTTARGLGAIEGMTGSWPLCHRLLAWWKIGVSATHTLTDTISPLLLSNFARNAALRMRTLLPRGVNEFMMNPSL